MTDETPKNELPGKDVLDILYHLSDGNPSLAARAYHEMFQGNKSYNSGLDRDDISKGWRAYRKNGTPGVISSCSSRRITDNAFMRVYALFGSDRSKLSRILGLGDENINRRMRAAEISPKIETAGRKYNGIRDPKRVYGRTSGKRSTRGYGTDKGFNN